MAKKKGGKKDSGKKDSAKKAGGKKGEKKARKKAARKAASLAPIPVKAGKGAPVGEVASQFVQMFNAQPGNDKAIWDALFHKKFTSTEGGMVWDGRKAVQAKADDFNAKHTVHSCLCEGPYTGTTGFGVKYTVDMTLKENGQRMQMTELAFYKVKNGKVVEEEFCYGPMPK